MPLDKNKLANDLKGTFQMAKDQAWSSDQVAAALASAISAFVVGADVVQVTVTVKDNSNNTVIGTGTQTGTGKLQ